MAKLTQKDSTKLVQKVFEILVGRSLLGYLLMAKKMLSQELVLIKVILEREIFGVRIEGDDGVSWNLTVVEDDINIAIK